MKCLLASLPCARREGIGATLYRALDAAKILEEKYGVSAEVWDLRFLNPLNYDPIVESVKKTGNLLLASDACERGSFMHNIASTISGLAFDYLDAPIAVVGSRNWITPAYELEDAFFPQAGWIIDAIHEKIVPLKGHIPAANFTDGEQIRRAKLGI